MKIIVAGSRNFKDYQLLVRTMDKMTAKTTDVIVVCGGARGADALGLQWAKDNEHQFRMFLPSWDVHGKSAGFIRNTEMARYADALVAFWDGHSNGTAHMIMQAKKYKLKRKVVVYGD